MKTASRSASSATNAAASSTAPGPGAIALRVNLVLFLIALAAIVVTINFFAQRPAFRGRLDATKTRAYSLTPATHDMLAGLQGPWTVVLVMDEKQADRAMRRQIDEVLVRYADANPNLKVLRIDPSNPRTMANYDAMLADLQRIYRQPMEQYDKALDQGVQAFNELQMFAQQQSALVTTVLDRLKPDDPLRPSLEQRAGVLGLLADQGNLVTAEVAKARQSSDARPIADYETARSILAQALSQWAGEVDELGRLLGRALDRPDTEPALKAQAVPTRQEYARVAQNLAKAADPLKSLPPMELGIIGEQLAQGEGAVIIGPSRAAVIPSKQLFPKTNIRTKSDGGVAFDQRFRGEQLLSAAIRSLTVPVMPLVVFMHAEDQSLFRPRDKQVDVVAAASMLQASRYDVAEWMLGQKSSERPRPQPGQPVVWIPIAPPARKGLEITPAERDLLAATQSLITEGQPVLLSMYPSLLHKIGQSDPWTALAEPFGLKVDTSKVILQRQSTAEGQTQVQRSAQVQDFDTSHAIGRAVDGSLAYFALPLPVQVIPGVVPGGPATHQTLASIESDPQRWMEPDWSADPSTLGEPNSSKLLTQAMPLVIAAERGRPGGGARQRMLLVSSGGWMLTRAADGVTPIGGGRVALVYPGNHELLLAGVAWLSGMDDLIAASPITQEVPRLRGVTPEVRALWFWIAVIIAPAICVALGAVVAVVRRM